MSKSLEELRKLYALKPTKGKYLSFLLCGEVGSGKTRSLLNCPKPILLDNFDTGGYKSVMKGIEEGWIIVRDWSSKSFRLWDNQFQKDLRNRDMFKLFGTYAIDSMTELVYKILDGVVEETNGHVTKTRKVMTRDKIMNSFIPEISDYRTVRSVLSLLITALVSLPTNVILTGHTVTRENELGGIFKELSWYNTAKTEVPKKIDEVYYLQRKKVGKEEKTVFSTSSTGTFPARSRLGVDSSKLAVHTIKAVLKQVGYPAEDKEW